ncbi:heavy-metal-associated domain-containing protein [Candidatus Daviesbacteria bacterium]|nr:heavy-metal-associated domain-containing protein [Candidatus Daviesbacteria bacterium]
MSKTTKKLFKITDMHCSSCALTIDMDLEDVEGVNWARTSYAKAELEVEFHPEKISEQKIIETVKISGYTAKL